MRGDLGRYLKWGHALLGIVAAILFIFVTNTPVAHADPHAMFYTVIGQQQLFFNVLAALDQADYVETPQQRQSLAQQRAAAGYKPEDYQTLVPTQTNLSSVLTRGVTLEGQDLWSAYQAQQLARETARRQATSEFVALGCERGLGRVGCSRNPSEWQQNQAFITDPLEWANRPFAEGVLGVALSGTDIDQQIRKDRLAGTTPQDPKSPRPFSPGIAELRVATKDNPLSSLYANYLIFTAVKSLLPPEDTADILKDLKFKDNGGIDLAFSLSKDNKSDGDKLNGVDYIDRALGAASTTSRLIAAFRREMVNGAEQVQNSQNIVSQSGAIGDVSLKPVIYPNKTIGSIDATITTPAHAKLALTEATANAIGNLDQNIAFAPPEAAKAPGNVKLVGPKDYTTATAGQVKGARTDNTGQVLGLLDNPYLTSYQENLLDAPNKPTNGPNVNPVSPNREEIITSALKAFTGDTYRYFDPSANNNSCGYCVSLSTLIRVMSEPAK